MSLFFNSVGVGFGPSNIALAIALEERGSTGRKSGHVFFDNRAEPDWHPGLMFEDATMQVSFLKDLITMVNPRSPYTFLNYIHSKGRIHDFINLRTFHPRRTEFEGYIKWCAKQMSRFAEFEATVMDVRLTVPESPERSDLTVTYRSNANGETHEVRTKSLVIADGGAPTWPLAHPQSAYCSVFHSSQTLPRLAKLGLRPDGAHQFHIVGSGQSAADTFAYLAKTYPQASIIMSHRSYAMRPEDDCGRTRSHRNRRAPQNRSRRERRPSHRPRHPGQSVSRNQCARHLRGRRCRPAAGSLYSGENLRIEHWVVAQHQGQTAARNMLGR